MNLKKTTRLSTHIKILKNSVTRFIDEDIFTQSAALSYYMVFSLPPMLVIIFWSAGLLYEEALVREAVFNELGKLIGQNGATQIMATIEKLTSAKPTLWAAIIGIGTLVFMASTVFVTVKQELNRIFEIKIERTIKQSVLKVVFDRFISIAMLCVIALLLIVSMLVSTVISTFGDMLLVWVGKYGFWLKLLDSILLNFIVLTILFAIIYRYIPDKKLNWKDTWIGGIYTAILFVGGKSLIAFSIGNSQVANYYDAAGSLLVFMLWVYYSSAIFYFGAILTHSRARSKLLN
jgi:membrane protein